MASNTLADILENAQMGRENALLGNYDTAVVYYQGVLQQIQKQMVRISDPYKKQKWQVVRNSLNITLSLDLQLKDFFAGMAHLVV